MPEKIIIDIHDSLNAKIINGNLIHQAEMDTVSRWIDQQLELADRKQIERLHETITITGTRGGGKTTFLLSLIEKFRNEKNKSLCVLDIIDPTLTEEKGHPFLHIISRIKKAVDDKLMSSDTDTNDQSYLQKKSWHDDVKKLAAGLPQLDGVGSEMTTPNWQDPEYIMSTGLTAVRSAIELEANFHKLVEKALGILKNDAFLIIFDDIDIDFRKGWQVIETIRKYFTTPRIITLISGDLRLYSKAIRKQQWKNFGKALLKNEGEQLGKIAEYNDLVTEMESQYMQKVIKLDRRISLTTLNEKLLLYERKYDFYIKNHSSTEISLSKYYDTILGLFGIYSESQLETYRSFLLSLPLRSQIQFMTAVDYTEPRRYLDILRVTGAFLNALYEKEVNIELANSNPKFLNAVILDLLLKENVLDNHYQLQPTSRDISLDSSLMALSFLSSQKMAQDPYLIFDYFVKIGYVRNIATAFPAVSAKDSAIQPSVNGLCLHAGIFQDKVLRDVVGLINSYLRGVLNIGREYNRAWGGTILLYSFGSVVKKGQEICATV